MNYFSLHHVKEIVSKIMLTVYKNRNDCCFRQNSGQNRLGIERQNLYDRHVICNVAACIIEVISCSSNAIADEYLAVRLSSYSLITIKYMKICIVFTPISVKQLVPAFVTAILLLRFLIMVSESRNRRTGNIGGAARTGFGFRIILNTLF